MEGFSSLTVVAGKIWMKKCPLDLEIWRSLVIHDKRCQCVEELEVD